MSHRIEGRRLLPGGAAAVALALALVAGGCAEKIAGPQQAARVVVALDLKGGAAVTFRLTAWAADMDTVSVLMVPDGDLLAGYLNIPAGVRRHFLVEALDIEGVVLYSGETVRDVVSLVPLDLTIPMEPVVPMLFLNPHFAQVPLGSPFTITVHANDLANLSNAGVGLSLFGFNGYKLAETALIDSVTLAPAQVERGSSLSYDNYGFGEIYFTVANEGPIVDDEGDGALVVVHCRTQDTWPGEPVELVPAMYIEVLGGYDGPEVYLDTARYRLVRSRVPESFLGDTYDDDGVALVNLGGGEALLAGTVRPASEGYFELYLARLGAGTTPLLEVRTDWSDYLTTSGLARGEGASFFISRVDPFQGSGAVARVNAFGGEAWYENLDQYGGGSPHAVAARPGGGCVAAGSWDNDGRHYLLMAFGPAGFQQRYAPADFSSDQELRAVVALDDTTFVAAGYRHPFSASGDAILAKFVLRGALSPVWVRPLGGEGHETALDLLRLGDGGFLMVGAVAANQGGLNDVLVIRTDAEGRPVWTRSFGSGDFDEVATTVCATPDGAFVAAGYVRNGRQNRDVFLVKFDGTGRQIWENTLGGPGDEYVRDIIPFGGGLLATGTASPGPLGGQDILVLRLGSDGKQLAE
ncbi:MAG: hypothetical protein IH621_16725 [Krumholzibacteria bacterium]|nr:hypothetical protein [Candidatus Krumholzibacteria bacterium]